MLSVSCWVKDILPFLESSETFCRRKSSQLCSLTPLTSTSVCSCFSYFQSTFPPLKRKNWELSFIYFQISLAQSCQSSCPCSMGPIRGSTWELLLLIVQLFCSRQSKWLLTFPPSAATHFLPCSPEYMHYTLQEMSFSREYVICLQPGSSVNDSADPLNLEGWKARIPSDPAMTTPASCSLKDPFYVSITPVLKGKSPVFHSTFCNYIVAR